MNGQEKSLNKKNGTLRGVEVHRFENDDWAETSAIGYRIGDSFFIGVGEVDGGYETEIALSKGALRRLLAAVEG